MAESVIAAPYNYPFATVILETNLLLNYAVVAVVLYALKCSAADLKRCRWKRFEDEYYHTSSATASRSVRE